VQFDGTAPTLISGIPAGPASDDGFLPAAGSTTPLKAALPGDYGLDVSQRGTALWDTDHQKVAVAGAGSVVQLTVVSDGSTAGAGVHVLEYREINEIYAP
jgi:hypothetical protein